MSPDAVIRPHLREHGPSTFQEIGVQSRIRTNRQNQIERLLIKRRSYTSETLPQSMTAVYYLENEHTTEEVLRKFIEVNPGLLDTPKPTLSAFFTRAGDDVRACWRRIIDDYDLPEQERRGGVQKGETKECPLCGETVYGTKLPFHFKDCDAA